MLEIDELTYMPPQVDMDDMTRLSHAEMIAKAEELEATLPKDWRARNLDRDILEGHLEEACARVIELLLSKREDYGTLNINLTGQHGVAVRLVDKTARLLNLTDSGFDPNHETVVDTWMDVVGYGLIGLILEQEGEW